MGVKHLFSNKNLLLYICLWYFFSGTTLFLNKYIISYQKGDAMFLGVIQLLSCTVTSYIYLRYLSLLAGKFKILQTNKSRAVFHFQSLFVHTSTMNNNEKKSSPTESHAGKTGGTSAQKAVSISIKLKRGVHNKNKQFGELKVKVNTEASLDLKTFLYERGRLGQLGGRVKNSGFDDVEFPNLSVDLPLEPSDAKEYSYLKGQVIGHGRNWRILKRNFTTSLKHAVIGALDSSASDDTSKVVFDTLDSAADLKQFFFVINVYNF